MCSTSSWSVWSCRRVFVALAVGVCGVAGVCVSLAVGECGVVSACVYH